MGVEGMRHMEIPAQDRNRTSPFPYGGHRFEFRAVGSAQNVSLVNTVLNTITANAFKEVADRIEGGETAQAVAADLINTHVPKVVFNGDNYDEANQEMLTKRGVWRIDSGVGGGARIKFSPEACRGRRLGRPPRRRCDVWTPDSLVDLPTGRRHLPLQRPEEHCPLRGHGRVETERVCGRVKHSPSRFFFFNFYFPQVRGAPGDLTGSLRGHRGHRSEVHVRGSVLNAAAQPTRRRRAADASTPCRPASPRRSRRADAARAPTLIVSPRCRRRIHR